MALTTAQILKRAPFYLNQTQIADFLALAVKLDITLDAFLAGSVYKPKDCTQDPHPYSADEQEQIFKDLAEIFIKIFAGKRPTSSKTYTASAGAPGVGKSDFIEKHLVAGNEIYIDPDRQVLRYMLRYKQISEWNGADAYNTMRDGSNYIANLLLVWAIYYGYSIVHGTTSTNIKVAQTILPILQDLGYKINIHVLFADADSRKAALEHRIAVQNFYQVTATDAVGKVVPVFERLRDAYLKYADVVELYYNTGTYWKNTSVAQDKLSLRNFASFDRDKDPNTLIVNPRQQDILARLMRDIRAEVTPQEKQEFLIRQFKYWFKQSYCGLTAFLPAFNARNVLISAAVLGAVVTVEYNKLRLNSNA